MEEIDYRSPILAQQKLERRIVSGLHVQHQLDVGPGHGLHIVSNPLAVKKLRFRAPMSRAPRAAPIGAMSLNLNTGENNRHAGAFPLCPKDELAGLRHAIKPPGTV